MAQEEGASKRHPRNQSKVGCTLGSFTVLNQEMIFVACELQLKVALAPKDIVIYNDRLFRIVSIAPEWWHYSLD
ncbi:hypothetical protein TURU_087777 [Turdus rufiventris]|nr:hypothetical protein TURU_087777 [Turdus rufiventris]